ncbi:P63C domain-containing protein [Arsenophonus sp.]|uniref:P63C domain-containing protein n=1 Tax=Arsenophonus sp. TaxID=1872640 RepID=UPI00285B5A4C|nr:P63C domain-containing protein [Arsenophonus sp.]MDR5616276.1 P63C domain-containing protein [Arsenophonus sp.]
MAFKLQNPLTFQGIDGIQKHLIAHGFDIIIIIDICKAIIDAKEANKLPESRLAAAKQAQMLINASAKTGIKNLAYAVAGYRPEVYEVIEAFKEFVREEARGYEKEFPEELYDAWYRIYQLNKPEGRGRPFIFRKLTNEQIYIPLAKSQGKILELAKNNKIENGKKNEKIHQFLSDVGVKALKQHIGKVLGVAALCDNKDEFEEALFGKLFKH